MYKYILIALILLIPSICNAGGRHYRYYYPQYYYVQPTVIQKESFIVNRRVTSALEVPGLQIVSDDNGIQFLVIDGKIVYTTDNPQFIKEQIQIRNGFKEEVRRTEIDNFGIKTIIEERSIVK